MGKTALVLSGGALFTSYQVGAWRALAGSIKPDMYVGTSAGALNAWCLAGGQTPDELIEEWLDERTGLLTGTRNSIPFRGLFDRRALEIRCRQLAERFQPQATIGITMVQVPALRSRIVSGPDIGWRHLLASCAIPGGFPPVFVDGRFYVDGGVLNSLPIWGAVAMGATRVIAINSLVGNPLPILRTFARGVKLLSQERQNTFEGVEILRIGPKRPLGNLQDATVWRKESIEKWIRLGEQDALEAIETGTHVA